MLYLGSCTSNNSKDDMRSSVSDHLMWKLKIAKELRVLGRGIS